MNIRIALVDSNSNIHVIMNILTRATWNFLRKNKKIWVICINIIRSIFMTMLYIFQLSTVENQMQSKGGYDHISPVQVQLDVIDLPSKSWKQVILNDHIDGLVQERCNSSALAMELWLSCTNPSIYTVRISPFVLNHLEEWHSWDWDQVTQICLSKLTIIGSDNSLLPGRRQAIISTNAGILLIRT